MTHPQCFIQAGPVIRLVYVAGAVTLKQAFNKTARLHVDPACWPSLERAGPLGTCGPACWSSLERAYGPCEWNAGTERACDRNVHAERAGPCQERSYGMCLTLISVIDQL